MTDEKLIGEIFAYFANIGVAAINLSDSLKLGDKIHVIGSTTDFIQKVKSMQIEHKPIDKVKPGDDVGLKVDDRVRPKDKIYKVL
ncbi:translation elongation factor-like protein [Candidatus Woesearchaeota archaeon]|nr:translation elongation factor-like protein [Candidatus Woesearchaeota archaeon]